MKKRKILFICPYPENVAPSQRLKFEQYYPAFREAGYEVHTSAFIDEAFWKIIYEKGHFYKKVVHTIKGYWRRTLDLFRVYQYDVVYIHLWFTPLGPPLFEWIVRRLSRKIVYDIDDLVYLAQTKSKAHPIVNLLKGRKKPIYLMKHAHHVITCTPYLDSFVRKYNQNTTDISSTVDVKKYVAKKDYHTDQRIVIGWSGSITTSRFLLTILPVLQKLAKTHPVKFLIMGDAALQLEGIELEALPWSEERELQTLQRFDIGLYPLPDEQWVYGKSGLKAIQYMALGIPTVATAIGANFRVIDDGVNGFLVKNEEEWFDRLSALIHDAALRERIGKAARLKVEKEFSVQVNKANYLSIINQVAS